MPPSKKSSTTKPNAKVITPAPATTAPNWPPLKPLLPTPSLSLTVLVPSHIILIRNFWTTTLCKNYVSFLRTLPLATTPGKPKKGEALRVNDRFSIEDAVFAERLWRDTGLRELLLRGVDSEQREGGDGERDDRDAAGVELWGGEVLGLNPMIRIYRYKKGQFFDCHYDESNVLTLSTSPKPTLARTTFTLLLYLTSPETGCQGGQTVFYPDEITHKKSPIGKEIVVDLETGMLLLHKHGNDCMLHEGKEVTEGEKWVIRTDVCVKR